MHFLTSLPRPPQPLVCFRRIRTASLAGIFATMQIACATTGSGNIEEKSFDVDAYDSISVANSFHADVVFGSDYDVTVKADDNIIDDVDVHQNGDKVSISLPHRNLANVTLEVIFTLPTVAGLKVADSSHLNASEGIFSDSVSILVEDSSHLSLRAEEDEFVEELDIACENSSSCEVELLADSSLIKVDDSSHLVIKGETVSLDTSVTNSSDLNAKRFVASDVQVHVQGSSSASVNASESVKGSVKNSSNLDVSGDAEVDVSVKNSSSVSKP